MACSIRLAGLGTACNWKRTQAHSPFLDFAGKSVLKHRGGAPSVRRQGHGGCAGQAAPAPVSPRRGLCSTDSCEVEYCATRHGCAAQGTGARQLEGGRRAAPERNSRPGGRVGWSSETSVDGIPITRMFTVAGLGCSRLQPLLGSRAALGWGRMSRIQLGGGGYRGEQGKVARRYRVRRSAERSVRRWPAEFHINPGRIFPLAGNLINDAPTICGFGGILDPRRACVPRLLEAGPS